MEAARSNVSLSEVEASSPSSDMLMRRRILALAMIVGLLGAAYAAYGIWLNPLRPHVQTRLGYYAFVDPSYYLRSARVLAKFRLPAGPLDYFYGLGYPVLGALFTKLGFRGDPFAPADVLLFAGICAFTLVLAVRLWSVVFGVISLTAGLVTVAVLVFGTPLFQFVLTPYNSLPAVFSLLAVLVLVTSVRTMTWGRGITIGLLLGWIFATRYGDLLFAGLPVAAAVVVRPRAERPRLVLGAALGLISIVALVAYTQYHAFGNPLLTPYHFHNRLTPGLGDDQSLKNYRLSWIPSHFIGEFITGRSNGVRVARDPMLRQFPLLPLVPVGVVALVRRAGRARAVWIATTLAFVLSSVFYLSFVAGGAGDLPFGNLRYWAIWYPLWAILAIIGSKVAFERVQRIIARDARPFATHRNAGNLDAPSR
ncbi:MAG: hypothetical protein M3Q30_21045 [Actinomycetota bacterium]|nr:hypothetical protein [Actinomycetota bacterium]